MARIELYRPANGTEGMIFEDRFCQRCRKGDDCFIVGNAMRYEVDDVNYPREWRYVDGEPTCTAFRDAAIPVVRSHKPGRTQLPLFDDGTDWGRCLAVADELDMAGKPDAAAKIRELVNLKNPQAEKLARKHKPELFPAELSGATNG